MINKPDVTADLAIDVQGLAQLKATAKQNSPAAVHAVAEQFEALFINQLLQQMRKASLAEGVGDSSEQKTYTSMFDQQIAQKIAHSKGIGLADMLARQLMPFANTTHPTNPTNPLPSAPATEVALKKK